MDEPALEYDDDVERLIAEHNGDVHAAIAVLLSERRFLIKELEYASLAMGYGFARGWRPKMTSKL
jgi:hypothetical protein